MDVTFFRTDLVDLEPWQTNITSYGACREPELNTSDTIDFIKGAFPDSQFKIVEGKPVPLAQKPIDYVSAIKSEAAERILDRYPLWKQANIDRSGGEAQAHQY